MIYLDNSATTYPKPLSVYNAMSQGIKNYGANPGRSGHTMSRKSGEEMERCRKIAAKLFNIKDFRNIAFTLNCTQAMNMVIKGILKPGDHVVTSCIEHNAVMRPLNKLEKDGVISYTAVKIYPGDNEKTLDSFRKGINSKTALIVCTHASNVWGIKLPVSRIVALARIYGIPVALDCAQSGGLVPINSETLGADFMCFAGHKGLYGPMGTGMLIANSAEKLDTIIEGGTGTDSMKLCQPKEMPQKFESGTPNMTGISGLRAGMEFVMNKGIENISNHEMNLMIYLYDKLKSIPKIKLYMQCPNSEFFVPLLSFNIGEYVSDDVGKILDKNLIEVRTGLQCAPSAHEFAGTSKTGVIRVSPSIFSTKSEIDRLVDVVKAIKFK